MKNLIKKILREEIEDDGFDWIRDIKYDSGEFFTNKKICFNPVNNNGCDVIISDNEYVFIINPGEFFEDLLDDFDVNSNRYFLEAAIEGSIENKIEIDNMDDDEFNYSNISDEQIIGLQLIIDGLGIDFDVSEKYGEGELTDLHYELIEHGYIDIAKDFGVMIKSVVDDIEYNVENNRWWDVKYVYEDLLNTMGGTEIYYNQDGNIEIKVPMEKLMKTINTKHVYDLTNILREILEPISSNSWSDTFSNNWDSTGTNYEHLIDDFIENTNKKLNNGEYIKNNDKLINIIKEFDFRPNNSPWLRGNYVMVVGDYSLLFGDIDITNGDLFVIELLNNSYTDNIKHLKFDEVEPYLKNYLNNLK